MTGCSVAVTAPTLGRSPAALAESCNNALAQGWALSAPEWRPVGGKGDTKDGVFVPGHTEGEFDRSVPLLVVKVGRYPLHHGGVGAIRTLGRVGVPVFAITEDRLTPAALSRHLRGRFVAPTTGLESEEQLLEIFSDVGKQIGRPVVALPTDDEAAVFIAEHADDLAPWFITPEIEPGLSRRLASKRGLHDICVELGIPAPRAVFPASAEVVTAFAEHATFPVVAKNVDPFSRLSHPAVNSSTVLKTPEELMALAADWPDPPSVMLQEYIPREVAEDWIFHAYCDRSSECLVAFTGVKYRSWPPRAGVTSYARIVANEALAEQSAALCRRLGYRGIVDLDWRFDRRDQQYKLLDFNPRVGAQFRLFETTAGIDVVRAMHLDLTGRPVPEGDPVVGRGFSVEILDAPAAIAYRLLGDGASPVPHPPGRVEPGWFARDDLKPAVAATVRAAAPLAARVRKLSGRAARQLQTVTLRRRAGTAAPILRDANSDPWTNRRSGPKVAAAVRPEKYKPGTDDSKDAFSNGDPATSRNERFKSSLRKPSASNPTR
jgi:D-aspartate ligase